MLKGRDFSPNRPTDSLGVLVNESAASAMSMRNPVGRQISSGALHFTIIGFLRILYSETIPRPFHRPGTAIPVIQPGNTGPDR